MDIDTPLSSSADDVPDAPLDPEKETEAENRYTEGMKELVFDELNMKREDGTFAHHYHDNIVKSMDTGVSKVLQSVGGSQI